MCYETELFAVNEKTKIMVVFGSNPKRVKWLLSKSPPKVLCNAMTIRGRRLDRTSSKVSYKDDSSSESEREQESDYEEVAPTLKRSKTPKKRAKKSKVTVDLEENLLENYIFLALSQPDTDVSEVVLEFLETYQKDPEDSITVLMNFILRSCGSLQNFEKHDLSNLESAKDTIAELTLAFESQKSHKYPFKTLLPFRNNVLEFFTKLISNSHDSGLLYSYDDSSSSLSSPLMLQFITWLGSLSSCSIRALRYNSTLILLTVLVQLSTTMKTITSALTKNEKQLKSMKNEAKLNKLNENRDSFLKQKDTIKEYFDDITSIVLAHRYRDVDPHIRQDCVKYLTQSMLIYPEYFLDAKFLRYFGWLLSDPTNPVRVEVSKDLLKLYKSINLNSLSTGLKQFTERYKLQFIKMVGIDVDNTVKLTLSSVCVELANFGFLDSNDNQEILSILFHLVEKNDSNSVKLLAELSKLIYNLNSAESKEKEEKYGLFFETYSSDQIGSGSGKLSLESCFKYKSLVSILQSSYEKYLLSEVTDKENVISSLFQHLSVLPFYENDWEFLIQYLLFDSSSLKFVSATESNENNVEIDEIKQELDLNNTDKLFLLNFLYGSFLSFLKNPNSKNRESISTTIFTKLVGYLPALHSLLIKSNPLLQTFLQLWHLLLSPTDIQINIYNSFDSLSQLNDYNEINISLLKFFETYQAESSQDDYGLIKSYEKYLNLLLNSFDVNNTNAVNLVTSDLRIRIQSVTQAISDIFASQLGHDDSIDDDVNVQKHLIDKLISIEAAAHKLTILGEQIDVNVYMKVSDSNATIIEIVNSRLLSQLNFELIIKNWSSNFLQVADTFNGSLQKLLNLILISTSWKLEQLISYDEESQQQHDIEAILDDDKTVINQLIILLQGLNDITDQIQQTQGSSSSIINSEVDSKKLNTKLNDCKTLISAKLIDMLTSIKIFYIKFNQANFRNFHQFFDQDDAFGSMIIDKLPKSLQSQLLDIYLVKESKVGKLLKIDLDRSDNENVNYQDEEDYNVENEKEVDDSQFQSDDEIDSAPIAENNDTKKNIWIFEKNLCVYTLKIFSLIKTSMVDKFIYERVQLNFKAIGGIYESLISQQIKALDGNDTTELAN